MGNTLLMYAVLKDRKDLCQLLLDKNADLTVRNNHNLNALQWAKINGSHKDIIKLLTEKGAN
jgi:ankyrin repeat protein